MLPKRMQYLCTCAHYRAGGWGHFVYDLFTVEVPHHLNCYVERCIDISAFNHQVCWFQWNNFVMTSDTQCQVWQVRAGDHVSSRFVVSILGRRPRQPDLTRQQVWRMSGCGGGFYFNVIWRELETTYLHNSEIWLSLSGHWLIYPPAMKPLRDTSLFPAALNLVFDKLDSPV